ncbi:MAG: trigger factor [Acidobacteriaceae bacterium]
MESPSTSEHATAAGAEATSGPTPESTTDSTPESATDIQQSDAATATEAQDEHAHHQHGPAFNPELTRNVEVTIPADEVSKAFRGAVKRYQKQARIPGFRAGKVPETLIRSRFSEGIRQEVLEAVMPSHFQNAIKEGNYKLVSQPQVVDMKMEDGQPLWFKATFEVLPEVSVEGYSEVKVEKPDTAFSDEDFNAELDRVRESRSTMEPVSEERPLAEGDWAQISFTGDFKEVEDEEGNSGPLEGQDVLLEVGGKNTIEAFSAALRGATVGQQLKFEVVYPADFGEARLAGKTVEYDVEVKGIKKRIQPELNDEFAKELGDYESYSDFTTKFREGLQREKDRRTETETREKLMESLVARYDFPVPESMVQAQIDARLDRGLRALAAQGMKEDDMKRLDFPRLREAQRESALNEVKGLLVLDKIADAEGIEVSDDEVQQELQMLALQLREPVDALRARLTGDGSMVRIREQLRRDKTGTLLYGRL